MARRQHSMGALRTLLGTMILLTTTSNMYSLAGDAEFEALIDKMEADVRDLALAAEAAYENRCSFETLEQCYSSSYEECISEYPNTMCPGGLELSIPACGEAGGVCGGLFDYSVSTTRVPEELADGENRNPTDDEAIETVCYTRELDDWFIRKHSQDINFWEDMGVESPSKMFGARDGIFRIYPGRHSRSCGEYDPRQRPWYIAASSGPKNIIMILDTSGSMEGYKMELLKEAAKHIVSTLTVADRVAIVEFNTDAQIISDNGGTMFTATAENKKKMLKRIEDLDARGQTNFYDAFALAFHTFKSTIQEELHVDCNSAILFLTDGKMTAPDGVGPQDVIQLVTTGIDEIRNMTHHPVMLLTYSISEDDESVHTFPKQVACSTELGVWSKIVDEDQLVESFTSYYLLLALGLGDSRNEDFVAWVEPYRFFTNDQLGTTASAPVYDRSVEPNILIGVAGYTFTLSAFDAALGVPQDSQETLDKIVLRSTAKCPTLSFSLCELESFRRQGSAGDEGLCFPASCNETDYVSIEPQMCPFLDDFPKQVFHNANYEGRKYEDRVCCKVGETMPSEECPAAGDDDVAVLGIVLAIVFGVIFISIIGFIIWRRCHSRSVPAQKQSTVPEQPEKKPSTQTPTIVVMPPPENPSYRPSAPPKY